MRLLQNPARLAVSLAAALIAGCNGSEDCDALASAGACSPLFWSISFGGPSWQSPQSIATDDQRNIINVGLFDGTIAPDGLHETASVSGADIFLTKHNPLGELLWFKTIPLSTPVPRVYLSADATGRMAITGSFDHNINFGDGQALKGREARDIFLALLDPDGSVLWAKAFGGPGSQFATGVALNEIGEIALVGTFEQTITLNKDMEAGTFPQNFVAKLRASDGRVLWSRTLDDAVEGHPPRVAIDIAGDVAVLAGHKSIWEVLKLNVAGDHMWTGDPGYDITADATECAGVILDYSGSVVSFTEAGGLLSITRRNGRYGSVEWDQGFTGGDMDWAALALGENDTLVLGGAFWGSLLLNVNGSDVEFLSTGKQDVVVASIDLGSGQVTSAAHYGGPGTQRITAITGDRAGSAIAAGDFRLSVDFGDGPITSRADEDVFIAKF